MAIFSRRTLQRLVDENSRFLSQKQTNDHVKRLNENDINVEWEIVLLSAFSKLGIVEHERDFNRKRPDLYFKANDSSFEFLSDIKTVSDEGIDIQNPYQQLNERVHQEVLKNDIKGAWRIDVGGNHEEAQRDGKMVRLKLPALARFDTEIFNENFDEFAQLIKASPLEPRTYKIKNGGTDLTISYSPSDRWVGTGSYPGYKNIDRREHLIQNSIYSGLAAKAAQLKDANYDGVRGILLCDGGSDFLPRGRNIIDEFLYTHPYINFVLVFRVDQGSGFRPQHQILIDYIRITPLDPELEELLSNFHIYSADAFPYPQRNATNAVYALKSGSREKLGSFFGGFTVRHNDITVSARTVLNLLAGNITSENFPESYRNFFAKQIADGRLFKKLEIVKSENEEDDDWLKITFGEPDPSISSFRKPD